MSDIQKAAAGTTAEKYSQHFIFGTRAKVEICTTIENYSEEDFRNILSFIAESARQHYLSVGNALNNRNVSDTTNESLKAAVDNRIATMTIESLTSKGLAGLRNDLIALKLYYLIANGTEKDVDDYSEIGKHLHGLAAQLIDRKGTKS